MFHSTNHGVTKKVRSKTPAAREPKRPNGHKVQLALRRDIDELQALLERQEKATATALKCISELENQLLAVGADRDGWRTRSEAHTRFMALLESQFGLDAKQKSWEERREQLMEQIVKQIS